MRNWEEQISKLENLILFRINESGAVNPANLMNTKFVAMADFNTDFVSKAVGVKLSPEEELIVFISLLPYLVPGYFGKVVSRIFPDGAELPELGGHKGAHHRGFIPTGETMLFLLAGNNLQQRLRVMQYFADDQPLLKNNILKIESVQEGEPLLSGRIMLQSEIVDMLLTRHTSRPRLSPDFPASCITTQLGWDMLIIHKTTMAEVETIQNWLTNHEKMVNAWELSDRFKSGYKALFYGPPGTGKTFTATLLGKQFHKDVYRIDLAQVVSKYIGETEKNLEKVFRKAENKNWILFFDEADALFGKRTSISSAHDRYANQETAYLLQRIEDYNGLVILASNDKSNIDPAFLRRFNAIVHFPVPDQEERLHLWKVYLPVKNALSAQDIELIASKYEVTGSTILNAIHNAALQAFTSARLIAYNDIIESIKRELRKEDRMPD